MSTFDDAVNDIKVAKDAIDGLVANQGVDKTKSAVNIQPKDTSKGHFYVSLVKSFLRITGFVTLFLAGTDPALMASWLKVTAGFLMLAECLGILEELV